MKRVVIVIGVLAVIGALIGGGLYLAFPVQMSTVGGLTRNYVLSLGAPAGTTKTETNADYKGAGAAGVPPAATTSTSAAAGDWPSYNRTVNSDRFSPLAEITTANVGKLKVLCTYDVGGTRPSNPA
jgi:alcohol dehydrogenase (cytochrome c)